MAKFRVQVPEVHYQTVEIEAESPGQAVSLVNDGEGNYLDDHLEYSHPLDTTERWVVNMDTKVEGQYGPE